MSHTCAHEHGGNGHGHDGHDGHDHSDDVTPALQSSLYQHIDFGQIEALNEATPGSGRSVVEKAWTDRLQDQPALESDADEQLLIHVPFTAQVKLHSILVRSSATPTAPRTLKVLINRDDIDFAAAEEAPATQELDLALTSEVQEIPVKRALFGQVRRLVLFFPDNHGHGEEDVTRLSYLGFRGDWMRLGRAPASITYESAANPADHVVKGVHVKKLGDSIGGPRRE